MSAPIVHFLGEDCAVETARYGNGRLAIELVCADGAPMACATVNLPNVPMGADEAAIKDYSENEGMLAAMMSAGIVSAPMRWVESGWVRVPICRIMPGLVSDARGDGE